MSFFNTQLYLKAISTTFLPVTSVYWLNTAIQTLSPFTSLLNQKDSSFINEYLADPSFTLLTTILFLPVLCGYLTDRISVFKSLRWLGSVYIVSGGLFVAAWVSADVWLSIACTLLFGFSLSLACVIVYVFVCEYMFRTSNYLDNLPRTLGACFILGAGACALFNFIDLKGSMVRFSLGGGLFFLSVCLSFYLSQNDVFLYILAEQLPRSASSSLIARKSIIFNGESSDENYEDLLLENEMNTHKNMSEKNFGSLKVLGINGFTTILTLSVFVGLSSTIRHEKQLNEFLAEWTSYGKSLQFGLWALAGLFVAFGKWQKNTLEKAIIGSTIAYLIVVIFQETKLGTRQTVSMFIMESVIAGFCLLTCLLYLPHLVEFRIRLMGKILGLFGWFAAFSQLIVKLNNQLYSVSNMPFDAVFISCAILSCLIFAGMKMKSWRVKETKSSQIAPINI